MATPLEISVACWYAADEGKVVDYFCKSSEANKAINTLQQHGILQYTTPAEPYLITEKGKSWVAMLTATPFPLVAMIDPRNGNMLNPVVDTVEAGLSLAEGWTLKVPTRPTPPVAVELAKPAEPGHP